MCHGRSWTPVDLAAQPLRDKAWRKRCAARLEASCPWIVHVSSMFRPWFILARFEAWGKFVYPTWLMTWVMTLPVSFGWDIISCFPFSMVSMAEEVKYILFLTIGFLNDTFFFNQVLLSRILSWLAIYLHYTERSELFRKHYIDCA